MTRPEAGRGRIAAKCSSEGGVGAATRRHGPEPTAIDFKPPIRSYLVGGAVRDGLLGLPVKDRDHVVVGARPEDLLSLGFKPVGKDFPVFLHPQDGSEYALARTERKTGRGYAGFAFYAEPGITLEDDLRRRDLTINAMALDEHGALIDPFGGSRDLEARVLRHVSPAFLEDPVRLLRVARFAARFAPLGFRVAEETLQLMTAMVRNGEVEHLVAERVWQELCRALGEARPSAFLDTLRACGALRVLFPEVDALYGVPQRAEFHPEVDTGVHIGMVLDMAARLAPADSVVGFAALTHDLGKALTPAELLPKHNGHEQSGVAPLLALCERLKVPVEHRDLALAACRFHLQAHQALELRPSTLLKLLEKLDAFRRPQRWQKFLTVCEADKRGRLGCNEDAYPQAEYLRSVQRVAAAVDAKAIVASGLSGPAVGERVRLARIEAIAALLQEGL